MVNVLFVELADSTVCVVPAAQITSLGIDSGPTTGDARAAVLEDLLDSPVLDDPSSAPRTLVVVRGDQKTVFRTSAGLQLGEVAENSFFKLPSVLRASTRPWVRGLVTLPESATDALAVWLDIHQLADTLWGEPHHGEQP